MNSKEKTIEHLARGILFVNEIQEVLYRFHKDISQHYMEKSLSIFPRTIK